MRASDGPAAERGRHRSLPHAHIRWLVEPTVGKCSERQIGCTQAQVGADDGVCGRTRPDLRPCAGFRVRAPGLDGQDLGKRNRHGWRCASGRHPAAQAGRSRSALRTGGGLNQTPAKNIREAQTVVL